MHDAFQIYCIEPLMVDKINTNMVFKMVFSLNLCILLQILQKASITKNEFLTRYGYQKHYFSCCTSVKESLQAQNELLTEK